MANFMVIIGPPGVGKGTQAKGIVETFGALHISSGNELRWHVKTKTELGLQAQEYMKKGELVPDEIVIGLIEAKLQSCTKKDQLVLLDGFPRTPAQNEALLAFLRKLGAKFLGALFLDADENNLVERLAGRWTCPHCQTAYNTTSSPPKTTGICDHDGVELYQRDDDKEATIRVRIQTYLAQTTALIQHYDEQNQLFVVDGNAPIDTVWETIDKTMQVILG